MGGGKGGREGVCEEGEGVRVRGVKRKREMGGCTT